MHFIEFRRTDTEWRPIFKYIVPFYTNRNYPKENKNKIRKYFMKIKWKQYKCVINKHILDVHCVRLHNYVHWLSILLYQEKKFILNQTHVVLEVFFSVFQNMTKSLNCQILFQKMNALKAQCTSILSCPRRKRKERKKKN